MYLVKYRFGFINWSVLPHAWGKSDQLTGIFVTDVKPTKPSNQKMDNLCEWNKYRDKLSWCYFDFSEIYLKV